MGLTNALEELMRDIAKITEEVGPKEFAWAHIELESGTTFKRYLIIDTDELDVLTDVLGGVEYNNGYGSQELFGVVVFKDGTWLDRDEYDGSESWRYNETPSRDEYSKKHGENTVVSIKENK
jgi:hypothetical protein